MLILVPGTSPGQAGLSGNCLGEGIVFFSSSTIILDKWLNLTVLGSAVWSLFMEFSYSRNDLSVTY